MNQEEHAGLLLTGGPIVTLGAQPMVHEDGAVWIQDGRIRAVGRVRDLPELPADLTRYDTGGRLIMPGLINAHMHFYSQLAVGLSCEPAQNFVEVLQRLWWRLDRALTPEAVRLSAALALVEGLKRGVTTVIDHHASPTCIDGSLALIEQAALQTGVRVNLCYEVTDRGGANEADAGIRENIRHIEHCARAADPRVTGTFGLHASLTLSEATLRRAAEAARGLGVGCHIHVAEDRADVQDCLQKSGMRVVDRLQAAGVLGPRSIAAHCVHVDASERRTLAASGTIVVHNPESNLNNAVGAADVEGLLADGVLLGLGTDGMTADVLSQARTTMLVRRHLRHQPMAGFGESVRMLLDHNAAIATRMIGQPLGALTPGALADITVPDYVPFTPLNAANFGGHLLFGLTRAPMHMVLVAGQVRLQDGRPVGIDEAQLCRSAQAAAREVWQRF